MTTSQSVARSVRADGPPVALSRRAALGRLGVGGLAAGLATRGTGRVEAQEEATPAAGPDAAGTPTQRGESAVDEAMAARSVRYQHPEKSYFYLPGFGDEAVVAAIHGLDVATYRAIKERFATAARQAAEALLGDPVFAGQVDRLPFRSGDTIVGIGESDTDDLQSWLEILRHVLDLRRGGDGIQVVNAAISGQTTTQALRLFPGTVLARRPNWVICGLGTNDLVGLGSPPSRTLVSLDETASNLLSMRQMAANAAEAEIGWVWMNRWPVDEARIAADPGFRMGQASWRNADIDALNAIVEAQPEPVVDLQAAFGRPPAPELLESDGLHPSPAGQQVTARAVVETLSA